MPNLIIDKHGLVTVFKINRPAKKNAICKDTALDLQQAFEEFDASDQRVAIITGEGNDAFSTGADVTHSPEMWRCTPGIGIRTEKPIIAATAGWVVGGALVLAAHCDLLVAAENTQFLYPEGKLGYTRAMVAGLVTRIPHKAAMDLMLLGRPMSASRAYDIGMASELAPTGQQVEVALEQAQRMVGYALMVLATLKRFATQMLPKSPTEYVNEINRQLNQVADSEDRQEGLAAFREKRAPKFTGR